MEKLYKLCPTLLKKDYSKTSKLLKNIFNIDNHHIVAQIKNII
jgi:hypothetical protein